MLESVHVNSSHKRIYIDPHLVSVGLGAKESLSRSYESMKNHYIYIIFFK